MVYFLSREILNFNNKKNGDKLKREKKNKQFLVNFLTCSIFEGDLLISHTYFIQFSSIYLFDYVLYCFVFLFFFLFILFFFPLNFQLLTDIHLISFSIFFFKVAFFLFSYKSLARQFSINFELN